MVSQSSISHLFLHVRLVKPTQIVKGCTGLAEAAKNVFSTVIP